MDDYRFKHHRLRNELMKLCTLENSGHLEEIGTLTLLTKRDFNWEDNDLEVLTYDHILGFTITYRKAHGNLPYSHVYISDTMFSQPYDGISLLLLGVSFYNYTRVLHNLLRNNIAVGRVASIQCSTDLFQPERSDPLRFKFVLYKKVYP